VVLNAEEPPIISEAKHSSLVDYTHINEVFDTSTVAIVVPPEPAKSRLTNNKLLNSDLEIKKLKEAML
jgi:hypothetical protein